MNTDYVNTYKQEVKREKIGDAIRDLAKARVAFGYGDDALARAALEMLRLVPEHNLPEAQQEVKERMDNHVIDVALATLSLIGIQLAWPGPDQRTRARHPCLASDLLDSRLGVEGANALENTVRDLLADSRSIGTNQLLEDFLARRNAEVK